MLMKQWLEIECEGWLCRLSRECLVSQKLNIDVTSIMIKRHYISSQNYSKNTVIKYLLGILIFFNLNHSHSSTEKNISSWTHFPWYISPLEGKGNEWHRNYLVLNFSSLATYEKGFQSQKVIFKLVYLNICFYSQLFKDLKAKPNRFHSTIMLAKGSHWWPKMVWPCLV